MEAKDSPPGPAAPAARDLDDETTAAAAIVKEALSCVAWDESVDLERLLVLEHAHNEALLLAAVDKAAQLMDARRHPSDPCLFAAGIGPRVGNWLTVVRQQGAWLLDEARVRMTDTELAGFFAVCARHGGFYLNYHLYEGDQGWRYDGPTRRSIEMPDFAHTWMARVATHLAGQTHAWTGIDIMRTHNLCGALIEILCTRMRIGPLAAVDVPKCAAPLDQSRAPRSAADLVSLCAHEAQRAVQAPTPDAEPAMASNTAGGGGDIEAAIESMRQGLARVASLQRRGIEFKPFDDDPCFDLSSRPLRTLDILRALRCFTERLYATEPYFCRLIAPAEYDAMAKGAPFGPTFYH